MDSGEKSDVAKIQSKVEWSGVGDETRSDRSLKFISSHWLCESLILEILDETYFLIIFFFLILDVIHAHSFKSFENTGGKES